MISEKQMVEANYATEAHHERYISQLSAKDLEISSYITSVSTASERARRAESEYERVCV